MIHSCIRQAQNNRYIQVCEWQIQFCQGNHCAAFVLSHFIAWHNWKLNHDEHYQRVNNIAELHGDARPHDKQAYLFFSMEEISTGILGIYGKNTINNALRFLATIGAISIHKNPNPRYNFDKTKYFIFYPEVCNVWIESSYVSNAQAEPLEPMCNQDIDNSQYFKNNSPSLKINSPSLKTNSSSTEINSPTLKKGQAITDTTNNTTNNTTNKNQSINASEKILDKNNFDSIALHVQSIVAALIGQGMPTKRFEHAGAIDAIQRLSHSGATLEVFLQAYKKAVSVANSSGFGVNYLVKVVEGMLTRRMSSSTGKNSMLAFIQQPPIFINAIPDNQDWTNGAI